MSPGLLAFLLQAGIVAAVGLGIYFFFRLSDRDWLSRVIAAAAPVTVAVQLEALFVRALRAPFWDWNAARLMPTFALTHGYKLYYPPNAGPSMNYMYGPMAAYAYLPATLATTPTAAILTASFVGLLWFFGPVLWILLQHSRQTAFARLVALAVFVVFCFFSYHSSPLSYSAFSIHADAPALGLCGCACAVLAMRRRPADVPVFIVSGLLGALAVWTKQTMVPILPGLIAYVWLADGRRCARKYTLWILVTGICVSIVFLALNDVRALIFNMFIKHLHHPWNNPVTGALPKEPFDRVRFLLISARLFFTAAALPLLAVLVYGVYRYAATAGTGLARVSRWTKENRWLLPTIIGVAMITTSIACRVGSGGDSNDQSPGVYFLTIGALLGLMQFVTETSGPRLARMAASAAFLVALAIFTYNGFIPPKNASNLLQALPYSPAQQTYQLAKEHPGMIYFPGNPLSSLLAEGKLYHFLMGLHERAMDGYPPSREYFWEYMPTNMQLIVLPDPAWMKDYVEEFRPYLQQFSPPTRDPASGWFIYRRVQ
jgi:hypothetical protein